ncbi:cyclic nucleotide-binding domain-containing protein [Candidatus Nephthysia bennettiae]|uniref:Cyclic nucleotide-binding domain-containing protein n=1 Tax=Candidatus Nephthysia bennettiae TaxID=3127016 RepID=A0A934K288_9BACT|nr:cyclic nucleotide-binding domain-containing protein [Candidatus Dormibacteraeota bacterium]MBJ7613927.1 cyclic nucleotide-binding domain-containing protein [Candidatus Dormibacteraeota bacterium]
MSGLPAQLTSFVGRTEELVRARRMASRSRLLTLTGSGGCGKTRLAVELGAALEREVGDLVFFCDLTAAGEGAAVGAVVAEAVGAAGRAPEELADRLRSRRAVLLLDNCEHVLLAAAELTGRLLHDSADLRVIATSREPLGIPGEITMRVGPLPLPGPLDRAPDRLLESAAVRLLVDRALLNDPDFELTAANGAAVAQACSRLDGIPLAIELAAAQLNAMTVETLVAGLDDRFRLLVSGPGRPPRQRTLEAAVDWSFALLSPEQRTVFARISVLAGSFSVDTARRVANAGLAGAPDALPILAGLVERSMLDLDRMGGGYRMPETLREYGQAVLRRSGEAVQVLAEAAEEADSRGAHWSALTLLQAALAQTTQEDVARRELLDKLAWQAECAGSYRVGVEALQALDELLTDGSELAARATVQLRLSSFLPMASGDLEAAEAAARLALDLYQAAGEHGRVRAVAVQLAWARGYGGDPSSQARAAREVAAEAQSVGDRVVLRNSLGAIGAACVPLGDLEEGVAALEEGLRIATEDGDRVQSQWFGALLALADGLRGQLTRARARLDRVPAMDQPSSLSLEVSTFLHHLAGNHRAVLREVEENASSVSAFHVRGIWILGLAAAAAAELGEAATARGFVARVQALGADRDFFYQSRASRWMSGVASWCAGEDERARDQLRGAAHALLDMGVRPLAALAFRDLADLALQLGDADEAGSALARLEGIARELPFPLVSALASPDALESAAELGRLGYHGLRARRLEQGGLVEEAAAAYSELGCDWRADRALAGLSRAGGAPPSPAARTLGRTVLLETATMSELEELAGSVTTARYRAGQLVHRRGEDARTLEVVESGRVRLAIASAAGVRVLGEAGPGELFGERALLAGELRATDALAVEDSRVIRLDPARVLRFMEGRPAIAERAVALLRTRTRQESALTGEPEPADAAGRLLAAVQQVGTAHGRTGSAYEILPVYLEEQGARLLRPLRHASLQIPAAEGVPAAVVGAALARMGVRAEIVHSTSWRYEGDRLVLTYLAILPRALEADGFETVSVARAELARGTAREAPSAIDVSQVLEHGLRHLSWLSRDDPAIREQLSGSWLAFVDRYQPEPFRAL